MCEISNARVELNTRNCSTFSLAPRHPEPPNSHSAAPPSQQSPVPFSLHQLSQASHVQLLRRALSALVPRISSSVEFQMDSFNDGSSPRPRRLDPDPFARLSDDLVAHILALVASKRFRFHPNPRLTAATATPGTTIATAAAAAAAAAAVAVSAAAEANAGGDGTNRASAERADGMAGNKAIAVNGSANSEDKDAHGDASEDELDECIARAVKKPCARFARVIQLTTAIALEAEATAANYARTMTLHIDPDDPDTPSAAHILASAYPPPLPGTSADSASLPPPPPPPPFTVFRHALVCKRWLRLARFSLPAILLQADRRLSTQTFRSFLLPFPPLPLPSHQHLPSFPRHHPLRLRLRRFPLLSPPFSAHPAAPAHRPISFRRHIRRSPSLHRHGYYGGLDDDDPDDAVATVTEPAVTALFAACRNLVSLKLFLPLCLLELPASVSLLQRLTRLDVSCARDDRDSRPVPDPEARFPESVGALSALRSLRIRAAYVRALPHTLSRLRSLTSLKIDGCVALRQLPDGLGQLKKLQYLELAKLNSLQSLPDSIGLLSSLETLHLRNINAASLPDSSAHLSSLKRLLLSHLSHMHSLPACVGKLPSLQELEIKFCARLTALPPSLAALSSLTALTVQHCDSLASLPDDIGDAPRLASLVLDFLPSLAAIPDSLALLSSLTHLHAAHCQELVSLPASFGGLCSLSRLHLLECSLESLPGDFGQLPALTELHLSQLACDLPDSFGQQLLKLTRLTITAYIDPSQHSHHPSSPHPLPSLRRLLILKCPSLTSLPSGLHLLPSLLHLDIRDCVKLTSLTPPPSSSPFPPTLQTLFLSNTLKDTSDMQHAISHLSSLQHLRIEHIPSLKTVPIVSSLETLSLYDLSLVSPLSIPNIHTLQKLRLLTLHTLPSLSPLPPLTALTHLQRLHLSRMEFSNLPEDLGQMQGLRVLTIDTAPKLSTLPASLTLLTSLQHLMISDCKTFSSLSEEGFGNLASLTSLTLNNLPLLLKLPAAVSCLASLQVLQVQECKNFSELPEGLGRAGNLREVYLEGCSQLEDLPQTLLEQPGRIQVNAKES
ncbi:unnamed protein product [Closterium sp. Yama58-4]|nr:unnamed protein product [Closterium sp. Yama58-4]